LKEVLMRKIVLLSLTLAATLAAADSTSQPAEAASGGVVSAETAKDARTAHVTLYHDAERPSALEIPVVR
jgi:hypothetical protein